MSLTKEKLDHIKAIAAVNKNWMWTADVLELCSDLEAMATEVDLLRENLSDKSGSLDKATGDLLVAQQKLQDVKARFDQADLVAQDLTAQLNAFEKSIHENHASECFAVQEKEVRLCHSCQTPNLETARFEGDPYPGWSICEQCWTKERPGCVACAIVNQAEKAMGR